MKGVTVTSNGGDVFHIIILQMLLIKERFFIIWSSPILFMTAGISLPSRGTQGTITWFKVESNPVIKN